MKIWICKTCGAHYPPSIGAPGGCKICLDDRQYVPLSGQAWTDVDSAQRDHTNIIYSEAPGLFGIGIQPVLGIGQRALLLQTDEGNILWDCIPLVDEATVALIKGLGGLKAIAISHPHFYTGQAEWSHAFGDVPVYLHASDRHYVTQPHDAIVYWEGERHPLVKGVTLINPGGHFPGSTVLHWADGAEGRGALLTADTINVAGHKQSVGFMYSYPNEIPLAAGVVQQIVDRLDGVAFEKIYGGWRGEVIAENGRQVVIDSAEKYIRKITD